MKYQDCSNCENEGIVFSEEVGTEYCSCDHGINKEFHDDLSVMKFALNKKFTTI